MTQETAETVTVVSTGAIRATERLNKVREWQAEFYKEVGLAKDTRQVLRRIRRYTDKTLASKLKQQALKTRRQKAPVAAQ